MTPRPNTIYRQNMNDSPPEGVLTSARRNIRRRRAANSCEACRRRKIRCDQKLPCAACVRARGSMMCVYRDGIPKTISHEGSQTSNVQDDSPRTGIQTSSPSTAATQAHRSEGEVSLRDADDGTLFQRASLCKGLLQIPPGGIASATTNEPSKSNSIPTPTPRLRQVADKTKMFGQSHWVHLADKMPTTHSFDGVEDRLSFDDTKEEFLKACHDIATQRKIVKYHKAAETPISVSDLLTTFPPKATCDGLVDGYFRTFEPLYRILHVPSFRRMYQGLWDPELQTSRTCPGDVAKTALIMAIGTTFFPAASETERRSLRDLAQTWMNSVQAWLMKPGDKINCTINGLQVYCILFLARQSTHNCPGPAGWISGGSLITMAMWMGLHRNPRVFPNLSPMQKQMRIRLWTTVLELAVQSSFDMAMPIGITLDGYDVPLPTNVDDSLLESAAGDDVLEESEGFTDSSLQILFAKSLGLRLKIVHLLNDFRNKQNYDAILELGSQLRHASHEVASFFRSDSFSRGSSGTSSTLMASDFHRKIIDIVLRRFSLRLHRDAMVQSQYDPRLYFARKICLESSMIILNHSGDITMSAPPDELDDLSRLSLVGRGLFKGPLEFDALLCLCFELLSQFGRHAALSSEIDPFDDLAKAERAPWIKRLWLSSKQLSQIIDTGTVSFKRHLVLLATLSQVEALEMGESPQPALAESVVAETKRCRQRVQEQMPDTRIQTQPASFLDDCQPSDLFSFGLNFEDVTMGWDISNMLNFGSMDVT